MCRAAIIGNAAGGKSTICRAIIEAHNLPLYAVDKLQWKPGWAPVPENEIAGELRRIIETDRWLLDGWGPWATIEERFEKADAIIFVDHSIWVHLWWAAKRQFKAWVAPERLDTPEGCDLAPMTWRLFKMIWMINRDLRPKLLSLVNRFKGTKDVYHIRSPRELREFELQLCSGQY